MEERIARNRGVALQRTSKGTRAVTLSQRRDFLEHLAATCNVSASARAAGVGAHTVYGLRQREPAFAAAWKEAIAAGYDRLEEELLAKALAEVVPMAFEAGAVGTVLVDAPPGKGGSEGGEGGGDGGDGGDGGGGEPPVPPARRGHRTPGSGVGGSGVGGKVARVDVQLALALLNRRQAAERAGPSRRNQPRASAEEVGKAINAKLDRLAARLGPPR